MMTQSISFHLMQDPRIPPPWWPSEFQDLLFECALRFDGGKLDQELAGREELDTYSALRRVYDTHYNRSRELLEDVKLNFGVFFWLQRSHKWSDMLSAPDRLLYLKLFLHLHDLDVPAGYEFEGWCRTYESRRREARALAETLRPLVARLDHEIPLPGEAEN